MFYDIQCLNKIRENAIWSINNAIAVIPGHSQSLMEMKIGNILAKSMLVMGDVQSEFMEVFSYILFLIG
jgi:hypothetical protein